MRTTKEIGQAIHAAAAVGDNAALRMLADEADALGSENGRCLMHIARGIVAANRSEHENAMEHYKAALAISEPVSDLIRTSSILNNLGNVLKNVGRLDEAMQHYSRALDLAERAKNSEFISMALGSLGILHVVMGDYARAQEYMAKGLAMEEERGAYGSAATSLSNLGLVAYSMGEFPVSIERYQRAFELHERSGNVRGMAIVLGNIGNSYVALDDHALAIDHFRRALILHEQVGNRASIARVNGNMGVALRSLKDHEGALRHLTLSASMAEEMGNVSELVFSTCTLADVYVVMGKPEDARMALKRIDGVPDSDPRMRIHRARINARILEAEGDLDAASTSYRQALAMAEQIGQRLMEAELHKEMRDLARARNDFDAYVEHNDAHAAITEEIKGKEATQRVAMMQSQAKIEAERAEKEKHRALLYNTLPPSIADRVLQGEVVNDSFDMAVVMFMDLVGFTTMSSIMAPNDVVALLSGIFTACDAIVAQHGLLKIKTIGDSYMAVGLRRDEQDEATDEPVLAAAKAACALLIMMTKQFPDVRVRIGIHCGPVTAGIIGTERLQYDVWGDTVNVASRMESAGEPGHIHVSETFAQQLTDDPSTAAFLSITSRGEMEIKGKGAMRTYFVSAR